MKGVAVDLWAGGAAEAAVLLRWRRGRMILLCCHWVAAWETQRGIQEALIKAVETGRLSEARVDESVARVAEAKARWTAVWAR